MTSLKTSIKTITYLSDIGCLEIQGASLFSEAAHHLTMSYQQYFVKDIYNVKTHQKRYSTLNMADVLWYPCSPS